MSYDSAVKEIEDLMTKAIGDLTTLVRFKHFDDKYLPRYKAILKREKMILRFIKTHLKAKEITDTNSLLKGD